jgi:hypothetical protein
MNSIAQHYMMKYECLRLNKVIQSNWLEKTQGDSCGDKLHPDVDLERLEKIAKSTQLTFIHSGAGFYLRKLRH